MAWRLEQEELEAALKLQSLSTALVKNAVAVAVAVVAAVAGACRPPEREADHRDPPCPLRPPRDLPEL